MTFGLEVILTNEPPMLTVTEYDPPRLGPNDVQVKMMAVALNYRDYALLQGTSFGAASDRYVPFSDACGIVESIGSEVTRWTIGDRVCPLFFPDWISGRPTVANRQALGSGQKGVGQKIFTTTEDALISAPSTLSDIEAAALPCAGLTAWNSIFGVNDLAPGDVVLLQGTGGVSLFALQFAHAAGLRTIVTSSSDKKLEAMKSLGAWATINYQKFPQWAEKAKQLNDGAGIDLVVEVGGAGTFAQSLEVIRPGGHISVVGMLTGGQQNIDIRQIYGKNAQLRGITVGTRETFAAMNRALDAHRIKPIINQVIPWRDATRALSELAQGSGMGKIILDFDSD